MRKLHVFLLVVLTCVFVAPVATADIKKNANRLAIVAILLIGMRWVDLYWQVAPSFHEHLTIHWLDFATLLAVAGVWVFLFFRQLAGHSLLPINAPGIREVLDSE